MRAIDCLVNVDFADRQMPDWMVRVKEDYFKGGDSFFASPDLEKLLDDMDANGVEKAILMTQVDVTEGRALSFVEKRPDRFSLGVGGFDLLSQLNAKPVRPKVLVLSARGREEDVTRAFELGADDYVTKPFNPQELLARVARLSR